LLTNHRPDDESILRAVRSHKLLLNEGQALSSRISSDMLLQYQGHHSQELAESCPGLANGKAGCDRLRHASGKVECELSTGGIFSSSKSSLPRLGDSRRGENPVNPTPP